MSKEHKLKDHSGSTRFTKVAHNLQEKQRVEVRRKLN